MEQNFTAAGMLKNKCVKYACTTKELSCIIGNVFAELSPPCNKCNGENIVLCGITPTGNAAALTIVKDGFIFEGDQMLIEAIRKRRCIENGKQTSD